MDDIENIQSTLTDVEWTKVSESPLNEVTGQGDERAWYTNLSLYITPNGRPETATHSQRSDSTQHSRRKSRIQPEDGIDSHPAEHTHNDQLQEQHTYKVTVAVRSDRYSQANSDLNDEKTARPVKHRLTVTNPQYDQWTVDNSHLPRQQLDSL